MTVLDTEEDAKGPVSSASSGPTDPTGATGPTVGTTATGSTGPTGSSRQPRPEIPVRIEGPLLGMNLTAYTRDGYGNPSVRLAMRRMARLGSTAVTLVPTWYMNSANSNRIAPDAHKTPSDRSLAAAIRWAREAGLQVVLKPHVDVIDDTFRGEIQPADRARWYRSYDRFIGRYAEFATSQGAEMFVIGTELKTLSGDTKEWQKIANTVRDRFYKPVTYAANWDEVDQVGFWPSLDAIGVDAYYPLSAEGETPDLDALTNAWREVARDLQKVSAEKDRPVLLTEVGYPSQTGATAKPFEVTDQPVNEELQALAYKATFKALSGSEWLVGISWWSWRADHFASEKMAVEYTPEGKKAQRALANGQWGFESG